MMRVVCSLAPLLLLVACPKSTPPQSVEVEQAVFVTAADGPAAGVASPELAALLVEHWDGLMARYPSWGTYIGDRRHDAELEDQRPEAVAAWREKLAQWEERAKGIDPTSLNAQDAVTLSLFTQNVHAMLASESCQQELWSVSARSNPLTDLAGLFEMTPLSGADSAAQLLARTRAAPAAITQTIANLRMGSAQGLVANKRSIELVLEQIARDAALPAAERALYEPLRREVVGMSPGDADAWRANMRAALTELDGTLKAYESLLHDELLPIARGDGSPGLASLPGGEACYEALVLKHTTLPLSPAELHQRGLDELARLHIEQIEMGKAALGLSDRKAIVEKLRADPALRFTSSEEVEAKAGAALERARAAIPEWFGILPQAPCEIARVPEHEAPFTTIAYYMQPAADGSRPGKYYVNVYAPETRPRQEAEVLAYHESIPGHHLQIAIAQELPMMPTFRREDGMTAMVEGWGLYSERLADEMGLYTGPLDRLGMNSFEQWRAARLVVDTGLHHLGWSRSQAEKFMLENTPLAENNIVNEVDRYITDPGQALAYKVGQMEIVALRREAEERLGKRFDIKGFHDAVLHGGAVSLPVLRAQVEQWITSNQDGAVVGEGQP